MEINGIIINKKLDEVYNDIPFNKVQRYILETVRDNAKKELPEYVEEPEPPKQRKTNNMREYNKEYREKNKERLRNYYKGWLEKNNPCDKLQCPDCNKKVCKSSISKHRKTKACLKVQENKLKESLETNI